ncbi:MAG: hypothetical protein H0W36_11050 [Gemmatimonadetes bacterium]|nr:hypothetical protein [Gemmatimonadota bacterium]
MGSRTPSKIAIIALMALGSVAMWVVNPVAWIWGVSQLAESSQVQMIHVVMIMAGIPVTMVAFGLGLGALNRLYGRVSGTGPTVRVAAPWQRSMRDERDSGAPRTVLDVVMVCSVALALLAMGVWFLFFAQGGGLPSA